MKARFVLESLMGDELSVEYLHYDPQTKTFSAEVSELPKRIRIGNSITVANPKTKAWREFKLYKTDMDGSGEDTYGWRYRSDDGLELLIIND